MSKNEVTRNDAVHVNYYFDMDGVLALYDRKAYQGDDPIFLKPGKHYFRSLPRDEIAWMIFNYLNSHAEELNASVYILTSLPGGDIFNEHFHDKILWLHEQFPNIRIEQILISVTNKNDTVKYIKNRSLQKRDILIDDFNRNLNQWLKSGGTAIKWCNTINDPYSFSGPRCNLKASFRDTLADILRATSDAVAA